MPDNSLDIDFEAGQLFEALRTRTTLTPLTQRYPQLSVKEAYAISQAILARRLDAGEKVVGKKIGLTNVKVQQRLGVNQPDFGFITDAMIIKSGDTVSIAQQLIQPKVEGELVFILKEDLQGPGLTNADIIRATHYVVPALEIVDSRIADWKITIGDTVADNASSGLLVLGEQLNLLADLDVVRCGVVMSINDEIVDTGVGAAAAGSPINAVTWLANQLGELGMPLKAGEVVLSGALVNMFDVKAGDRVKVAIGGAGECAVQFD